jgi:hypothetical protein
MVRPPIALLLAVAGCSVPDRGPPESYISPLDGEDAVALDGPLVLHNAAGALPPSVALPDTLVRVVDLDAGGLVEGVLKNVDGNLVFRPDEPWMPDRRYHWRVEPVVAPPRAPTWSLPESLVGDAVFSTLDVVSVLDLVIDTELGGVCGPLSRQVEIEELADMRVTLDDEPLGSFRARLWNEEGVLQRPLEADPQVSVLCLEELPRKLEGRSLRVWLGRSTWQSVLRPGSAAELAEERRRWGWEP